MEKDNTFKADGLEPIRKIDTKFGEPMNKKIIIMEYPKDSSKMEWSSLKKMMIEDLENLLKDIKDEHCLFTGILGQMDYLTKKWNRVYNNDNETRKLAQEMEQELIRMKKIIGKK